LDRLGLWVQLVSLDRLGLRGLRELREIRERWDLLARWVLRGLKVLEDCKGFKDMRECRELLVPSALSGQLDLLGRQALLALWERWGWCFGGAIRRS
jgi:hypothetical protein